MDFLGKVVVELFDSAIAARNAANTILKSTAPDVIGAEGSSDILLKYAALSFLRAVLVAYRKMDPNDAYDVSTSNILVLVQQTQEIGIVFQEATRKTLALCSDETSSPPRIAERPFETNKATAKMLMDAVDEIEACVRCALAEFRFDLPVRRNSLH